MLCYINSLACGAMSEKHLPQVPRTQVQKNRQILIWDTSQYVQLRTSMGMATLPRHDLDRFAADLAGSELPPAIQLHNHMPGTRGPLIVLLCRAKTLNDSSVQRDFQQVLHFLEEQGCKVPKIQGQYFGPDQLIPESELMALQHTRWIFDERDFGGSTKRLSDVFIARKALVR